MLPAWVWHIVLRVYLSSGSGLPFRGASVLPETSRPSTGPTASWSLYPLAPELQSLRKVAARSSGLTELQAGEGYENRGPLLIGQFSVGRKREAIDACRVVDRFLIRARLNLCERMTFAREAVA